MSELARKRMTSDGFWAMEQGGRYELVVGEIVGMAVEVHATTTYEPDTPVLCGTPLPSGTLKLNDPIIVVEVVSPSSLARDAGAKLEDCFRLTSARHCLILKAENRTIVHHQRGEDGIILTRIVHQGPILLDPPGINLIDCFPPGGH